ncbi:MAG TPA: hypothetical protein VMV81_09910, partial [Phycisphaerae bacterium]|nr:hypothetical protein [Phycisphaerae bacterium]
FEAQGSLSGWRNNLHGSFGPAVRAAYGITNERPTVQTEMGGNLQYSETPTITYRPLQGEEFSRRVMAPIPPSVVIFLTQSGWSVDRLFACCVQQVNGISNRALHDCGVETPESKEFVLLLTLLRKLQDRGRARFATETENGVQVTVLYIPETPPGSEPELDELRRLLGYPPEGNLRLRVTGNSARRSPDELAIQTRSVLATLYALAQQCAAPSDHIKNHEVGDDSIAETDELTWMRIQHSRVPQIDPFVQVHYNGYWFFISKGDWSSKRTFALLTYLFSLQAANPGGQEVPLVTVGTGP